MEGKKYDRSIYFDVSTFDNLREKGIELVNVLTNLIEYFILPFNRPLVISTEKINGKTKTFRFNGLNWSKVSQSLINGEIQHVLIRHDSDSFEQSHYYNSAISLGVTCDYIHQFLDMGFSHSIANNVAFSVSERLFDGLISQDFQNRYISLFKKTFIELNGVVGYLTFERETAKIGPNETGLEALLNLYFASHSQHFDKVARGYFWGNILSEGHIQLLGGIDCILNNAPCEVELLEFKDRKAVYLQLTSDINIYSDTQLYNLKKFFTPILPIEDMEKINKNDPTGKLKEWSRLVFD